MSVFMQIILLVVCVLMYTGQTFFNKLYAGSYQGPKATATPVFAGVYGIIVAIITFSMNGFALHPSGITVIFGVFNGVVLFLYNLGMIQAAAKGPYSFQSIVMLFGSIVVCMLFSAIFWGDKITVIQIIGIVIMLASFVVINSGGLRFNNIKKGYYFWVISLFVTNGIYGVLMDAQQRSVANEKNEMIFFTFLSSAVISIVYLLIISKGKIAPAFKTGKKAAICMLISSCCAGFAVFLLMVLLGYIPSYILYTINNGSILVLSAILCAVVLKEKITKQTIIGIILAVISIVTLSI